MLNQVRHFFAMTAGSAALAMAVSTPAAGQGCEFGATKTGPFADVDTFTPTVIPLTVRDNAIITDLDVSVKMDIDFGCFSDIALKLVKVGSGLEVDLILPDGSFSCPAVGSADLVFDDEAAVEYVDGILSGPVRPDGGSLSVFDGAELKGDWELHISDEDVPEDGDTLIEWSLSGSGIDCEPFTGPDVCVDFDGASGTPPSYTESGVTVTSLFAGGHVHLGGGVLANNSGCCSTPYLFDIGGTPFSVVSIDVVSTSGASTFTSSDGGVVAITGAGTIDFPVTGWTEITDFRWDVASGDVEIDNVCLALMAENAAPVCDVGSDQTIQCNNTLTTVTLDGSGSFDPDGDPLEFQWSVPAGSTATVADPDAAVTTGDFPIGPTMVTLTVSDPFGGIDVCDVMITIVDEVAPVVVCTTDVATLWPPRHNMVEVFVSVMASDECVAPADLVVMCTAASSEPDDDNGDGEFTGDVDGFDGFAAPVPVILSYNAATETWDGSLSLRAERDGRQSGRTYSIVCEVADTEGNVATSSCVVMVPHDRRGGGGNNN